MNRFLGAFSIGLLIFILGNVLSYLLFSDGPEVADGLRRLGFPFFFWSEGGIAPVSHFSPFPFWSDMAMGLLGCALAGIISLMTNPERKYRRRRNSVTK